MREEHSLQPLAPDTQLGAHEQHAEYDNEVGRSLIDNKIYEYKRRDTVCNNNK